MDKKEKAVRLVDVGELETELDTLLDLMLRDFADETNEMKCHCQAVAMESEDLKKLPTIDPESLRPVSEWELNPYRFSCEHFRCKECHHIDCIADNYCGKCGARMKNAGVKPEDLPIPEEENSRAKKSDDGNGEWEECGGME